MLGELLRDPRETSGKGNMSALGTHEITSGIGLGLEPPLSPPVVRGSGEPEPGFQPELPTPALRPPEAPPAPAAEPAPVPQEIAPMPELAPIEPVPVPVEPAPLMTPLPAEPAPVFPETPVFPEAPVLQPEPELPAMAPEPEQEPAPPVIPVNFPPAPAPEPAEPPAAEIPAELLLIDPFLPIAPAQPDPEPPAPLDHPLLQELSPKGGYQVVVRLQDGDGIDVGEFGDFSTAMEGAQEVIEQFTNAGGSWPFYAGRFIRPDLIVSVDVLDA
jgi:hypothetical protein